MMNADHPEVVCSLQEASIRVEAIRGELLDAYPALRGSLAIPGMLIGHGLASFVASGMTDDQIVAHMRVFIEHARDARRKIQPPA